MTSGFKVDGMEPVTTVRPETADALAAELVRAGKAGRKVLAGGYGSRMSCGVPLPPAARAGGPELLLLTTALSRILEHEPADLTVTVEAGCDVRALDAALGARGQFLPLQGRRRLGTVGGLLATAPEGLLALGHGQPRDSLLGVRIALADGSLIKAGGRVVKNVAGFPIHRLMTGSFGTLGVIVEASFKVQPRPEREATALVAFASADRAFDAARRLLESGTEPVFANVLMGEVEVLGAAPGGKAEGARPAGAIAQRRAGSEMGFAAPRALAGEEAGAVFPLTALGELGTGIALLAVGFDGLQARVSAHLRAVADLVAPAGPIGIRFLEGIEQQALRDLLDDPSTGGSARGPAREPSRSAAGAGAEDCGREVPTGDAADRSREAGGEALSAGTPGQDPAEHLSAIEIPARAVFRATALPSRIEESAQASLAAARRRGGRAQADVRPGLGSMFVTVQAFEAESLAGAVGEALAAARSRGHAALVRAPLDLRRALDTWGPPPPDFPLMRRIKEALDPGGLFVAGRFVGGL